MKPIKTLLGVAHHLGKYDIVVSLVDGNSFNTREFSFIIVFYNNTCLLLCVI